MMIREILAKDIDAILALNEISVKVLSPMDARKLRQLIENSALAVVVEEANEVAGFLLAFTHGVQYESINYKWFNQHYDAFLYVDRIVVSAKFRGKGIASTLYQYVIDWAMAHSLPSIFVEIDVMPPNVPSLSFHKKWGFKELAVLMHHAEKRVSLQALKIS